MALGVKDAWMIVSVLSRCFQLKDMTLDILLLPQSWSFCITNNLGVSGFTCRIFLSSKAHSNLNFQRVCKILVSNTISDSQGHGYFPMSLFMLSLYSLQKMMKFPHIFCWGDFGETGLISRNFQKGKWKFPFPLNFP